MKSLSILFVFFTVSASLIAPCAVSQLQNCPGQLLPLTPCMGEIFSFISLKRPISSYCCARISDVSDNCPRPFRPWWFVEGEESCIAHSASPPPSPSHDGGNVATPPPPASSPPPASPSSGGNTTTPPPPTSPSNGGNTTTPPPPPFNGCPDTLRIIPCLPEMSNYHYENGVISSSCCTTIVDVRSKCSTEEWNDFYTDCLDYCKNHH